MSFWTRIITIVTLLSLLGYAANCDPRYFDAVNLRVFTENYIPVEGAMVSVTYQLDRTTDKGYFTATRLTNANGEANFSIQNLEVDANKVDCSIKINASFDSQQMTKTITAQGHSNPVDMLLKVYPLTVRAVDQNDRPLAGAEVFVQNRSGITDTFGRANFLAGEGSVRILATYDIGKIEEEIVVTGPLVHTVGFVFYPLTVRAIDDQGSPLEAAVTVENETYELNGTRMFPKIAKAKPTVRIRYENVEKQVDTDLAVQSEYTSVFDLRPPRLVDVQPTRIGSDRLRLSLDIVDEGAFASGIRADGIVVNYRYDAGDWKTVRVYSTAHNQYATDLPLRSDASMLFFTLEARDEEGNSATFDGQFSVGGGPRTNQTNSTTVLPSPPASSAQGLPLLPIGAIAGVALILYLVYRFKLSKGGGGE